MAAVMRSDTSGSAVDMAEYYFMNSNDISLQDVYDVNNLYNAFQKCKKESIWKESVQRYEANLLINLRDTYNEIASGTFQQKPFNEFTLHERGKTRNIKAVCIHDRVVLASFCENILVPYYRKYLIYDNGASLKGKGIDFTKRRLRAHLQKYYRENGSNDGYILLIDFTKYFDNIRHDKLIEEFNSRMDNPEVTAFLSRLIDSFKIDVSYMNDDEYQRCMETPFNALAVSNIDRKLLTGEKFMSKSVGIGSQISQIAGLLYPTRIDNYCKIVKGLKYYGRYMDDTYIIHKDKKYLKQLLVEIDDICKDYGIFINKDKTQIIKLSRTFTFLKTRYFLTNTGKVIERMNKDAIIRERKRLKTYRGMYDTGKLSYKTIENAYFSWRGNAVHYNSFHTVRSMDRLYNRLFIAPFLTGEDYGRFRKRTKRTAYQGHSGNSEFVCLRRG